MRTTILISLIAAATALTACSSSSTTPAPTPAVDSGTPKDSGTVTATDSGVDATTANDAATGEDSATTVDASTAEPLLINGCTTFADLTSAATPTITFTTGSAPQQYDMPCIKVHANQTVTWSGALANHPLEATPSAGDPNNPIPATGVSTGTSTTVTFTTPGTYPFNCAFHPTLMLGAVYVVAD